MKDVMLPTGIYTIRFGRLEMIHTIEIIFWAGFKEKNYYVSTIFETINFLTKLMRYEKTS